MKKQTSGKKTPPRVIATNRKARHDYTLEETFEAGLVLEGWEVKSLRAGRAQLKESYVIVKNHEIWLIGAHLTPLANTCQHTDPDPRRTRKLLLSHREIKKLTRARVREGYTIIALDLHWRRSRVKLQIALAKGKKKHDKRDSEKKRDWERRKQSLTRQ